MSALSDRHLLREMRVIDGPISTSVNGGDAEAKLLFCSNDYLGLAGHPSLATAVRDAVEYWGVGAASSRLVSGNTSAHDRLERRLAAFCNKPRSLYFASGYQANVGAIPALAQAGDHIFSDERSHASLIDGCRLSKADRSVFRHNDVAHLEELLAAHPCDGVRLIVTESVFSMDGDRCPLRDIVAVAKRHDAEVYLDEAHAIGVLGPQGRGLAADLGLQRDVAVMVGTLGKAAALCGAFVGCDETVAKLLVSSGRSLMYSTSPPPLIPHTAMAAIELIELADERRWALAQNVKFFKKCAAAAHLPLIESETPIQPILIGAAERTTAVSQWLWRSGIFVQGIRPPTVPEGTGRLRVTLLATHTRGQIEVLVDAVARALREVS